MVVVVVVVEVVVVEVVVGGSVDGSEVVGSAQQVETLMVGPSGPFMHLTCAYKPLIQTFTKLTVTSAQSSEFSDVGIMSPG